MPGRLNQIIARILPGYGNSRRTAESHTSPLWRATAASVHRGEPGSGSWHPEQAITIAEAIAASTDGNRIAVGQPGDVALLDTDPLTSNAEGLRDMPVALTCVAGRIVHSDLDA